GDSAAPDPTANARPTPAVRPAAGSPAGAPDEFASTGADFAQFCIRCHKADGTGGVAEFDGGKTLKVPNLRERGRDDSDEELAEQIRDGGDGMPPFKNRLDEKRINDLVRFIRKEFHGRDAAAPPAR
ncbi:MAG TPA: cytochrome c, partial [Pyrinomonadaceae bacterium]|nr:cytochrome c [Pyrinomonadaceae bacterium]